MRTTVSCVMFLMTITISVAKADVTVFSKKVRYNLSFGDKYILLHGKGYRLSMKRTKCNQKIVMNFESDIESLLKKLSLLRRRPSPWHYVVDGKKFYADYMIPTEKVLLFIPEEFRRLKLQNKYLCK